jgi:hypothetical protein
MTALSHVCKEESEGIGSEDHGGRLALSVSLRDRFSLQGNLGNQPCLTHPRDLGMTRLEGI